jgi:hypothetical protein
VLDPGQILKGTTEAITATKKKAAQVSGLVGGKNGPTRKRATPDIEKQIEVEGHMDLDQRGTTHI